MDMSVNFVKNELHNLVKRIFFRDYPVFEPQNLPAIAQPGNRVSLGSLNKGREICIVWREPPGSGFFSNYQTFVAEAIHCAETGAVPVVDCETFRMLYNEAGPVNGTRNSWEYYFEPMSDVSVTDAWKSENVTFESPRNAIISAKTNAEYRNFCNKFARLRSDIICEANQKIANLLSDKPVLGIHFRGKEHNTTPGHFYCPTPQQMFCAIDHAINTNGYRSLFLVTEEADYLDLLAKRYGPRLKATEAFRAHKINAYNLRQARPQHRYLLGREILIDTCLLMRCDALLSSHTGVMAHALKMSTSIKKLYLINNGINFRNIFLAKYSYNIRKHLPPGFGGLKSNLLEIPWPLPGDAVYAIPNKMGKYASSVVSLS